MTQYRKRPVVIEAFQLSHNFLRSSEPFPDWFQEAVARDEIHVIGLGQFSTGPSYAKIKTLNGVMRVDMGEWIIRGVQGEIYPCKDEIFAATYEDVPESVQPSEPAAAVQAPGELPEQGGYKWEITDEMISEGVRELRESGSLWCESSSDCLVVRTILERALACRKCAPQEPAEPTLLTRAAAVIEHYTEGLREGYMVLPERTMWHRADADKAEYDSMVALVAELRAAQRVTVPEQTQ